MALSTKCLRYLTLVADIVFMLCGAGAAVLQLVFSLPVLTLLPLPRWLLPPALLPLLPALLAVPAGFLAFRITRSGHRLKLIAVTCVQVLLALVMSGLACWQIALCFVPRLESDLSALMEGSLHDRKWDTVHHELACCGPAGPVSFHRPVLGPGGAPQVPQGVSGPGVPLSCCQRGRLDGRDAGFCSQLYTQGCIGPTAEMVRDMLRRGAALDGGIALFMFLCAASSAFLADALKRQEEKRREEHSSPEDKPLRGTVLNQRF